MKPLASVTRWDIVAWMAWIAAFGILEGLGLSFKHLSTLTNVIRNTIPAWVRAPILGWLVYHFLIQKG